MVKIRHLHVCSRFNSIVTNNVTLAAQCRSTVYVLDYVDTLMRLNQEYVSADRLSELPQLDVPPASMTSILERESAEEVTVKYRSRYSIENK